VWRIAPRSLSARACAAGVPVYLAACAVPDGGLFRERRFRDVHLYGEFADRIVHGGAPYRDFFMEYPPGALAVFLPPRLVGAGNGYIDAFKVLMALLGAATLVLVVLLLVRLGASRGHVLAATALLALSPIALGPISLNTYDGFPALLTVAALAALVWGWDLAALALLGFAFAAKVYPAVLLPAALVFVWRTRGPRRAAAGLGVFAGVAAAVVVPFLALAPHGLAESFRAQAGRSLQLESLGGQVLVAADHLGLYSATVVHRTRHTISYDLAGGLPDALATLTSVLQALAVVAATVLYVRSRGDARRLGLAFAASVAGFIAFSRFVSPQYLVWLVPLVVLVFRPVAWALLGAALVLAQLWFFHYPGLSELSDRNWLVLVRDLVLAAVFVVLLRHAAKDEDPVLLEDKAPLRVPS
jgi:4-amino-4-deoxy-L-arabinose transferase-like glycosyltransferase